VATSGRGNGVRLKVLALVEKTNKISVYTQIFPTRTVLYIEKDLPIGQVLDGVMNTERIT